MTMFKLCIDLLQTYIYKRHFFGLCVIEIPLTGDSITTVYISYHPREIATKQILSASEHSKM